MLEFVAGLAIVWFMFGLLIHIPICFANHTHISRAARHIFDRYKWAGPFVVLFGFAASVAVWPHVFFSEKK